MLPDSLEANGLAYSRCPANTNDLATPLLVNYMWHTDVEGKVTVGLIFQVCCRPVTFMLACELESDPLLLLKEIFRSRTKNGLGSLWILMQEVHIGHFFLTMSMLLLVLQIV